MSQAPYDATYAFTQLLAALAANVAPGVRHDATTALAGVLPQAHRPADGRAPFTLPPAAASLSAPATSLHPSPTAAHVTAAVAQLNTERPKKGPS